MKKILIILLLLVNQLGLTKSSWGLKSDTENRLISALELSHDQKFYKSNKMGSFVTVGDDSGCDFRVGTTKIQNAIDSGATEIRIASNTIYEENLVINNPNISLTLRGGFADCSQADLGNQSNLVNDWTEVTRVSGQSGSVFTINELAQGVVTVFENIKITGGDAQGVASGAGIGVFNTESDLVLNRVWLTQGNNLFAGGGLAVLSSNTRVILRDTDIFNNSTVVGGGIYCDNFNSPLKKASIIITDSSSLYGNISENGGGAFIGTGCLLSSFSGSATINTGKGIFNNNANGDGGGVYAIGGGDVLIYGGMLCDVNNECFGNEDSPASVYGNQTVINVSGHNNGGAFFGSGMGTDITIIAGHIHTNSAETTTISGGLGGAIALFDNATANIAHPRTDNLALNCWNQDRCNLFNNNTAHSGGSIFTSNSTINISHVYFEDNRAQSGVAIYSSGVGETNIESSVFNHNGDAGNGDFTDNYLIQAVNGPNINLVYSTIADNNTQSGILHITDLASSLLIKSSIVHDVNSGDVINSFPGTIVSNCVMAHEITSLPGTNNSEDDPEFVDRINRDYHLNSSTSPAIDYCDVIPLITNIIPTASNKDIDFQAHGFDNINLSNFLGAYDLGADEAYPQNLVTIGGDANCDFNTNTQTVQDAINTGVLEIRLANSGSYNQPIIIDDINLKLRGGFATCDDARNNTVSNTKTTLMGSVGPVKSIIEVKGSTLRNTIQLEGLFLTGSPISAISAIDVNAEINLNDVFIQQNNLVAGFSGGAIFASAGNTDFTLHNTFVVNNTANNGGGIFCSGADTSITVTGLSGISFNSADGQGGGVYITSGCQFTNYAGTTNTTVFSFPGIQDNNAKQEGGGIYADLGAKVVLYGHELCSAPGVCVGDNINPVNVNNNRSDSDSSGSERGGGIYLTGLGTSVEIYAGLIQSNLSPNGAGIYVNDQAILTVARLFDDCWDTVRCNFFHNNRAFTTGGAIQNDQGIVNISSTYFEENKGTSGSALYAFGALSRNRIEGSVFNHNEHASSVNNAYVIRAAVSAKVEIAHSTFADNSVENIAVFGIASNSELKLFSSIISDPTGVVLDTNPGTLIIDCVMAHETSSFSGSNIFLNDPDFIDRVNLNYHLSANSPAIDVCDNSFANVQFRDIDFESRGVDNPNAPNNIGTYDIGADETPGNDVLFANGFE